jgi:hypothetical protein
MKRKNGVPSRGVGEGEANERVVTSHRHALIRYTVLLLLRVALPPTTITPADHTSRSRAPVSPANDSVVVLRRRRREVLGTRQPLVSAQQQRPQRLRQLGHVDGARQLVVLNAEPRQRRWELGTPSKRTSRHMAAHATCCSNDSKNLETPRSAASQSSGRRNNEIETPPYRIPSPGPSASKSAARSRINFRRKS